MSYTDPVAHTEGDDKIADDVMAAVSFVNDHGGWNGNSKYLLVKDANTDAGGTAIRFQQYYREVPIVSEKDMNFGFMQLTLQQGGVSSYSRSLTVLGGEIKNKSQRALPGGDQLRSILHNVTASGKTIEALFPAMRPVLKAPIRSCLARYGRCGCRAEK